ncbi:ribonuclease P protein subunit p25-like protein isoform X2 [Cydia pomonella]|uniref:ribonuclease P protein subunit p25-like protein isoform X2 n=1 Tax=Cydia pomonella TaxID=82600 RepID=UPI002ADE5C11|nr:ribonuclease P protein subunit p25-like protein isoform X2 [Cydia pomonella]
MENYFKGKNVEEELQRDKIPIKDLPENFLWMQVKGGSKMANLLSHASGILEDKAATAVVWTGTGVGIPKAISCAEIIKRQFSIEHQVTKLAYKNVEEFWEPKVDGLETIVVKRYQSLQGKKFWQKDPANNSQKQHQSYKSKKPFKHKKNQTNTS